MSGPPGDLLSVDAVLNRYGLRDRRAARRIMDEAGAFKLGANLYVRAEDLVAHEDAQKAARRPAPKPAAPPAPQPARPRGQTIATRPGWWRESTDGGTLPPPNRKR